MTFLFYFSTDLHELIQPVFLRSPYLQYWSNIDLNFFSLEEAVVFSNSSDISWRIELLTSTAVASSST